MISFQQQSGDWDEIKKTLPLRRTCHGELKTLLQTATLERDQGKQNALGSIISVLVRRTIMWKHWFNQWKPIWWRQLPSGHRRYANAFIRYIWIDSNHCAIRTRKGTNSANKRHRIYTKSNPQRVPKSTSLMRQMNDFWRIIECCRNLQKHYRLLRCKRLDRNLSVGDFQLFI